MQPGILYFVEDSFFEKVNDPYLKINHETTKRPHYYVFKDKDTALYWVIPCSSQVEKYKRIIEQKQKRGKPTDAIKIIRIHNRESVLLFQDMLPIALHYIKEPYIRNNQPVLVADPKVQLEIAETAHKIMKMLCRGVKLTPTQPDVNRIARIMIAELQETEVAATKESQNNVQK